MKKAWLWAYARDDSSSAAVVWTYPAAFVGFVIVTATPSWDGSTCLAGTESTTSMAASISVRNLAGNWIARACALTAVWRWF